MSSATRRRFLGGLAAGTLVVAAGALVRRRRSQTAIASSDAPTPVVTSSRALLVDALLPRTERLPGALDAGVEEYLQAALSAKEFSGVAKLLAEGVQRLEARTPLGNWAALGSDDRVRSLRDAMASDETFAWESFRDALLDFVLEGYLGHPARGGNRGGRVWTAVGLNLPNGSDPSKTAEADLFRVVRSRVTPGALGKVERERWDVIVVGSGAGGGAAAWRLSKKGLKVLVLEKGPRLPQRALIPDEIGSCLRDAFVPFTSDDPHIVFDGVARPSHEGWTSVCVGGGTVHMSAMLYRMHEDDFDAKTRFGSPPGHTLIDWPFRYDVLRPYYDEVQAHLGLSGETGANPFDPAGAPFPAPPLRAHPAALSVDRVATAAGLHPFPTPRGIATVDRGSRRACIQCGYCGAYACPVGAKASSVDAFLPEAEATGNCHVLPGAAAVRISEEGGRVLGVLVQAEGGGLHEIRAPKVVLAASAVESARLLLVSDSPRYPGGLGNASRQVGANLVFSLEAAGRARFPYPSTLFPHEQDGMPFLNRSFQDRYVDREASGPYPKIGTLVVERAHMNPILRARHAARHPNVALGADLTQRLEASLCDAREIIYESFVEMLPRSGTSVALAPEQTGIEGTPAALIRIDDAPHEAERAARMTSLARRILEPLSPSELHEDSALRRTTFLQAGTCRMGSSEESSVCDASGRVRGISGLFVVDGGALPTMGGVPPTFTIMANALRVADLLVTER